MCDPTNGNIPTLVLRHKGIPEQKEWGLIMRVLSICGMELTKEANLREDGLWCHPVKEARC